MKRIVTSLFLAALAGLNAWAQGAYEQLTITEDGVCQISTAEDLANFAQAVNDGEKDLDAVLTADIQGYTGPAISLEGQGNAYNGTFDGQCHTLDINLKTEGANWGLFRALSGTVKNLHVSGMFEAANNRVGVICGEIFGGTVENCWVSADIAATYNGDGAIAGICGRASGTGSMIRNCVFSGNVKGIAYNCAGIVGWCPNVISIQHCIVTGEFNTDQSQGNAKPIARYDDANNTNADCLDCYYVYPNGDKVNINTTQVPVEALSSGKLTYQMNGDQSQITWTQTIGTDPVPVPFPTHATVYAEGSLNCVGQSTDGTELTYSNTKTTDLPPHEYKNGICVVCGHPEPDLAEMVDGFYQLGTPEQLVWFATKVNNGETSINAVLTNDIDMRGYEDQFPAIGTNENRYAGSFDGQGYTVTIDLVAPTSSYGFFRYLTGAVCNLHIDGTYKANFNKTGVICGEIFGGIIENCWVSSNISALYGGDAATAGIVGRGSADGSLIRNCLFSGNIDQENTTTYNCASFMGWSGSKTTIENCLFTGKITVDESQGNAFVIARNPDNLTIVNCYFLNSYASVNNGATQVTEEQLKSGEIALALGAAFRQNIGEDDYPVLDETHGIVKEITSAGYATLYIPETAVLIPEGVEAFNGFIVDDQLWLRPQGNVIICGQAVVLKGSAGYYSFIPMRDIDGYIVSDLKGAYGDVEADGAQYVLAEKDGVVGFYQAEPGTVIAAGKAYMQFASSVKGFALNFDCETGIEEIQNAESVPSEIFDLSGRRVEKATKGIYIMNGKKYLK